MAAPSLLGSCVLSRHSLVHFYMRGVVGYSGAMSSTIFSGLPCSPTCSRVRVCHYTQQRKGDKLKQCTQCTSTILQHCNPGCWDKTSTVNLACYHKSYSIEPTGSVSSTCRMLEVAAVITQLPACCVSGLSVTNFITTHDVTQRQCYHLFAIRCTTVLTLIR